MTDDLALAAQLVREAGQLAATMLRAGLDTEHKTSVSDVVSEADRAAEVLVAEKLRAARPDDGIVGEEGASHPGVRTWFIDPVDGTYNFLNGLAHWCSALAMSDPARGEKPVLGAVYHPAADELFLGGQDQATTLNGSEVPRLAEAALSQLSLGTYLNPTRLDQPDLREPMLEVLAGAAAVRMLGSGSIELASVASGRLGGWIQPDTFDWDWLPGAALVTAAGGVATVLHHRGHRWHLAGNAQIVAEMTELLMG